MLNRGDEITVLDQPASPSKNLSKYSDYDNFHYSGGDVRDKSFLESLISEDYEKIFHLAAIVGVENYCEKPLETVDVNVGGTRNIVELALEKNIKLIFTSTSEVFGKNPDVPWSEKSDRVLGPTSIDRWSYSTSKSLCEHMLFAVHDKYGLPVVIIRYFNVYGPRQKPIFVVPAMIEKVLNDENPVVYDSGRQTRCFTYIKDAIEGTILASESSRAEGESFNIGNIQETSIKNLAEKIIEVSGKENLEPEFINPEDMYGSDYEDLDRRVPEVKKAKKLLSWKPSTNLKEGIEKTLRWFRDNPNYYNS